MSIPRVVRGRSVPLGCCGSAACRSGGTAADRPARTPRTGEVRHSVPVRCEHPRQPAARSA
eukprot:6387999-Prymnesium_polylepis.2